MSIKIYDSFSNTLKRFTNLKKNKVSMYYCGPTVQSYPHIGHLRSALVFDQINRWFSYSGYNVLAIRNITDVDDKILKNSKILNKDWKLLSFFYEKRFNDAYEAVNLKKVSYEPKVTCHINDIQYYIKKIIDNKYAYTITDNSDVYFDISSWLKNNKECTLNRINNKSIIKNNLKNNFKKNIQDFALWKTYKPYEPRSASWESPWGIGRPGWHIECSVIANKYLGRNFDIHGGGIDLKFPHHYNEMIQAQAIGNKFANFWIHNELVVNEKGSKFSKSNLKKEQFSLEYIFNKYDPLTLRHYLGSVHYRTKLKFSIDALKSHYYSINKINNFMKKSRFLINKILDFQTFNKINQYTKFLNNHSSQLKDFKIPKEFILAMNNDFNIPLALSVLYKKINECNKQLYSCFSSSISLYNFEKISLLIDESSKVHKDSILYLDFCKSYFKIKSMLNILGVNPLSKKWNSFQYKRHSIILNNLLDKIIKIRQINKNKKKYQNSDFIRKLLYQSGISLEDINQNITLFSIM